MAYIVKGPNSPQASLFIPSLEGDTATEFHKKADVILVCKLYPSQSCFIQMPRKFRKCRKPQVGDVVIFHPDFALRSGPSWFNDDVFIKRIVAVAGDTIEVTLSSTLSFCPDGHILAKVSDKSAISCFRCSFFSRLYVSACCLL